MSVTAAETIFRHGKERDFSEEEFFSLSDEMIDALEQGDRMRYESLARTLPANPVVAKAFKDVYGKDRLLQLGLDLTEADRRYGEGWLDEPSER